MKTTPVDVFPNPILSYEGENISIKAERKSIYLSLLNLRYNVALIRNLVKQRDGNEKLKQIHSNLNKRGLRLYLQLRGLKVQIMGKRVSPVIFSILLNINRIIKRMA